MKAGKSQDLQVELASWRLGKANGIVSIWKGSRFDTKKKPVFQLKYEGRRKPSVPVQRQ